MQVGNRCQLNNDCDGGLIYILANLNSFSMFSSLNAAGLSYVKAASFLF